MCLAFCGVLKTLLSFVPNQLFLSSFEIYNFILKVYLQFKLISIFYNNYIIYVILKFIL